MSPLTILDNIQIASPCDADWSKMTGDDRTRFCDSCSKHVYNIAAMTADQATALIVETQGKICGRIYKRADGTVLTADCPVGLRKISRSRRLRQALAAGVILPALAMAGASAMGILRRGEVDPFPSGPGVTWDDRIDWALVTLGIRPRQVFSAGMMALPAGFFDSTSSSGTADCSADEVPAELTPPLAPSEPVVDQ